MIAMCPYCKVDTAGNHDYACPNHPRRHRIGGSFIGNNPTLEKIDPCPYCAAKDETIRQQAFESKEMDEFNLNIIKHHEDTIKVYLQRFIEAEKKVKRQAAEIEAYKEKVKSEHRAWDELDSNNQQQAAEIERLKKERTFWYNQGYLSGHHDTVEACYTDIVASDMETYHQDIVDDIGKELKGQDNER